MPLPLGGAKGSGMSLAFELLTSVLVGAPIFADFHSGDPTGRKHRQNALLIAVYPAAFGGAEPFAESVEATLATLKTLTPADGAEGACTTPANAAPPSPPSGPRTASRSP